MNLAELGIRMSPNMVAGDSINYSLPHEYMQSMSLGGVADFEQRLRSESHHVVAGDRTIWLVLQSIEEDVMRRCSILRFDCTHVTSSATPQWAQGGFASGTFVSGGFPAQPTPPPPTPPPLPKRNTGPDLARSFRRRLHLT